MIHDSLAQAAQKYYVMHPLFAKAFDYVSGHFDELSASASNGKHAIQSDDLFVIVGDNQLKRPEDAALEAHNKYIDIQILLSGSESFGWSQRIACTEPKGEFDTERDIIFYNDLPTSQVTAQPGEFVIFFPEDAHAPLIRPAGVSGGTRKAIVKVRVDAK